MLSCKKATELIEKDLLVGLSRKERLKLRVHLSMCDGCKAYQKQSQQIDKFLAHHIGKDNTEIIPILENKVLKDRIITKLKP